jgi:hypothetical protein
MNVTADAFSAESSISAVPLEVAVPNVFELLELKRPEVKMTPLPSDSSRSDENSPDGTIVGVVDCPTGVGNRRSSFGWITLNINVTMIIQLCSCIRVNGKILF